MSKLLVNLNSPALKIIKRNVYYQYKYSPKLEVVMNQQIQAEQQAAQNYLNCATIFLHPSYSRPGGGNYFMKMYREELDHMQQLIEYQLLRGGTLLINGIKAPAHKKLTLLEAFNEALKMEKTVTELLENIVTVAENVKDFQCADFITTVFLSEQMKSISEISHHITNLTRICSDEHAIYHYDLELLKLYPQTFKMNTETNRNKK